MSNVSAWERYYTNDIILTIPWPGYNLQTKYKLQTCWVVSLMQCSCFVQKLSWKYLHQSNKKRCSGTLISIRDFKWLFADFDKIFTHLNTFICSKWTKQTPAQMWKELQNYNHEVFSCPPQKYTFFVSKPIFGVKVWVASQI